MYAASSLFRKSAVLKQAVAASEGLRWATEAI